MPVSTRKNAIYNVGYRMLSVLLPIVTAPYLARTVGQEGTGLYAYAWSISAIFVLLGMLGLAPLWCCMWGTLYLWQGRSNTLPHG